MWDHRHGDRPHEACGAPGYGECGIEGGLEVPRGAMQFCITQWFGGKGAGIVGAMNRAAADGGLSRDESRGHGSRGAKLSAGPR